MSESGVERTVRVRDGKVPLSLLPPSEASRTIYGTGSPLGAVSAPVGTKYVDEAGTLGAWEWLKKSGTGTSGWEVIHGDTGWRNIATLAQSDWDLATPAGMFKIRRDNSLVHLVFRLDRVATGGSTSSPANYIMADSLPEGFRNRASNIGYQAIGVLMNNSGLGLVSFGGDSNRPSVQIHPARNWVEGEYISSSLSFLTEDSWPTVLPGTPA